MLEYIYSSTILCKVIYCNILKNQLFLLVVLCTVVNIFHRYAEVYTAEEVVRITRDKLIRLQSLYIDQFRILRHKLKECKRDYLTQVAQGNVGKGQCINVAKKLSEIH